VAKAFDPARLRFDAEVETLGNGLRIAVHRELRAPLVGVQVSYPAGSRAEPPGRHGLAHLFEHLMFYGSEHSRENYFIALEQAGALAINANAVDDCASYFQTVPAGALDYALWMEAERMSCVVDALDQAALDGQREVVRNELLERQNAPGGRVPDAIRRHSYPASHPYSHHYYGSLEELDNITLDDVRRWYKTHHGAASAVVVIAGEVEPARAIELARRRFGTVPPGAPQPAPQPSIARLTKPLRMRMTESHAAKRLYRVWNVPPSGSADGAAVELACELFAGGGASRLFRRLVSGTQIASDVEIELQARQLGSQVVLCITASPRAKLSVIEQALDDEVSCLASEPPSEAECAAARVRIAARFIRDTERLCGPRSRSDEMAMAMLRGLPPAAANASLQTMAALTRDEVAAAASYWLDGMHLTIEVSPSTSSQSPVSV
jgi:zinc protease